MTLPKILIIGQSFNNDSGGGITLSNLFAGWDIDKIAVVSTGHIFHNLDPTICNQYYQLGQKEYKWIIPLNYLQKKFVSGPLEFKEPLESKKLVINKTKLRAKIINNYFYPLVKFCGLFHALSKIELSNDLCDWINKFNPDVIYSQASSRETIIFCQELHKFIKKPLVFHMMDDWPLTISSKGLFRKYWFKRIDCEFRALINRASVLMSISDEMAHEYKNRYNKNFITFHNPIDIEIWKKHQRSNYELSESPTILYAGKISLGVETSLESIAKAIQIVNDELKISIKFVLQTKKKPLWIDNYKWVEHNNFVAYNSLPKVFSEADFLILPYDFSKESIKYVKYSMPTKAPEYMISGTPIIIFSPNETAIVKYAEKYEWANVITENNPIKLAEAIKYLIQNKKNREYIAQNAKAIAEKNHNSITITKKFREVISSLV